MNTPTISSALNMASTDSSRTSTAGKAVDADGANGRFSDMLTAQNTPGSPASGAGFKNPAEKTGHQASANKDKPDETPDDESALLASESGLTPPQLALSIAAQAASSFIPNAMQGAGGDNATASLTAITGSLLVPGVQTSASTLSSDDALAGQARLASDALTSGLQPTTATAGLTATDPRQPQAAIRLAPLHQTQIEAAKTSTQLVKGEPGKLQPDGAATIVPDTNATEGRANTQILSGQLADSSTARGAKADLTDPADTAGFAGNLSGAESSMLNSPSTPAPGSGNSVQQIMTNLSIVAPLQHPQWASQLGRQFITLAQTGHNQPQTAELRLDPPELGPLRITINISDNIAHAVFTSPHAAVRQAVEAALPQLQQLLSQQGISLGQTSVNDQNQSQAMYDEATAGRKKPSGVAISGGSVTASVAARPATRVLAPNALVDTFV